MIEQTTLQEEITNRAIDLLGDYPDRAIAEETVPCAVMNLVEEHFYETDYNVTVGYGIDREMVQSNRPDYPDRWWSRIPPVEGRRFRVFVPEDEPGDVLDFVALVMGAIGATPVDSFPDDGYDSYDHRDRTALHYVLPDGSPIHRQVEMLR